MPIGISRCILHSMERSRPWWKSILLNARALACGVLVAVGSVSAYEWADASINGGILFLPANEHARIAAIFAASIALQLLVVCVPIWLVLGKLRMTGWVSAALLGFIAPLAYWIVMNGSPVLDVVRQGFPYALCGALAGLVVWWARPKASPRLLPANQ